MQFFFGTILLKKILKKLKLKKTNKSIYDMNEKIHTYLMILHKSINNFKCFIFFILILSNYAKNIRI